MCIYFQLFIEKGLWFGGTTSEEMTELETARYLPRENTLKYATYNKILMEHCFPTRAPTTAGECMNVLHQFSLGLSKALITC